MKKQETWTILIRKDIYQSLITKKAQMLEVTDAYFKAAILTMLKM